MVFEACILQWRNFSRGICDWLETFEISRTVASLCVCSCLETDRQGASCWSCGGRDLSGNILWEMLATRNVCDSKGVLRCEGTSLGISVCVFHSVNLYSRFPKDSFVDRSHKIQASVVSRIKRYRPTMVPNSFSPFILPYFHLICLYR